VTRGLPSSSYAAPVGTGWSGSLSAIGLTSPQQLFTSSDTSIGARVARSAEAAAGGSQQLEPQAIVETCGNLQIWMAGW
jgi:hypothetical protein